MALQMTLRTAPSGTASFGNTAPLLPPLSFSLGGLGPPFLHSLCVSCCGCSSPQFINEALQENEHISSDEDGDEAYGNWIEYSNNKHTSPLHGDMRYPSLPVDDLVVLDHPQKVGGKIATNQSPGAKPSELEVFCRRSSD